MPASGITDRKIGSTLQAGCRKVVGLFGLYREKPLMPVVHRQNGQACDEPNGLPSACSVVPRDEHPAGAKPGGSIAGGDAR
jgi:hypothetical protein